MNAVARTTPPWNPPDGLVWACEASHQPITTTGPMNNRADHPDGVLVAGTFAVRGLVDR